jgi:hypothetical protein
MESEARGSAAAKILKYIIDMNMTNTFQITFSLGLNSVYVWHTRTITQSKPLFFSPLVLSSFAHPVVELAKAFDAFVVATRAQIARALCFIVMQRHYAAAAGG